MADTWTPYQITGVLIPASGPSPTPLRRDICELQAEKELKYQFTLFILAWEKIMRPGFKPEAASFQGIAGIHGMPYTPWPGDPDEARQTDRGPFLGYCNHGSILFPTWHRPHLMLLEQSISDTAVGIAGEFAAENPAEAECWLKAARDLRLPFWDWTHPRTKEDGIPHFFKTPKIEIYMPTGHEVKHKNPLYSYEFIKEVDGFNNRLQLNRIYNKPGIAYFKEWTRTYRNPDSRPSGTTDNYVEIDARLTSETQFQSESESGTITWQQGSWAQLTNTVSQLFAFPNEVEEKLRANVWDEFSNTTVQSAPARDSKDRPVRRWQAANSLEAPHNTIHVTLGGVGHMSDNDTAGFDPIFYLHHCNIDRLLSFWQHIYPDYVAGTTGYYVGEGEPRKDFTQSGGTWIQQDNQKVDETSPLLPFRNLNYKYWTSKDAYSLNYTNPKNEEDGYLSNKYYTYPPIVINENTAIEIDTDPKKPTSINDRRKQRRYLQDYFRYDPREARANAPRVLQGLFKKQAPFQGSHGVSPKREPVEDFRQFVVALTLSPTLLEGSYSVVITFKMSGPGDKETTLEIGQVTVLSRGRSDLCGNCQSKRAADARVHGTVLVPHQLVALALYHEGKHTEDTKDEEVVRHIWTRLGASLRLPNATGYATLAESPDKDAEPLSQAPQIALLSCDVYLKRQTERPLEGEKDEESLHDIPYDFDDWQFHSPLTDLPKNTVSTPNGPKQAGGSQRTWVLY